MSGREKFVELFGNACLETIRSLVATYRYVKGCDYRAARSKLFELHGYLDTLERSVEGMMKDDAERAISLLEHY